MITLLILLTAHFVGDFLCQTDWMATNKSKSWEALSIHVSVYTFVVLVLTATGIGLLYLQDGPQLPFGVFLKFTIATFVTHFLTDAVTSRITTKLYPFVKHNGVWVRALTYTKHVGGDRTAVIADDEPIAFPLSEKKGNYRHWFFVAIGADQLIHAWTLALTWMWAIA